MLGKKRISQWLVGAVILAMAECAAMVALDVALTDTAQAQFFGDDRYPSRQRPQRSGGFFDNLFGPSNRRVIEGEPAPQSQGPADNSRAPSPRKADAKAEPATTSIVVMGDGMADWLAYGLEDAFADTPEIGILRKNKLHSGLLRYEPKGDLDWWHVARDILSEEKANYVVMMLGVGDRQNIREKDLAKEADKKEADKSKEADKKKPGDQPNKPDADKSAADKEQADDPDQPSIAAPEPKPGKKANGVIEFRTDQWAEVYSKRIDETIAALKSKGVPVFWVGLPSLRGSRSTADAVYLNDLYRARAERAGAVYIDVWDGFVDEGGKYSNFGPDYEGQMRRLRSNDGVYFTKYGARKLAHYVEREVRRYMSNRALQVSLPSSPAALAPGEAKSAARPLAGPVVPLTVTGTSEELLGGSGSGSAHGDAIATSVLVKGEPVPAPPGRADDFVWPRGSSQANAAQPVAAVPAAAAAASASAPAASAYTEPPAAAAAKKPAEPKSGAAGKATQNAAPKPKPQREAPRPPQPVRPTGGPFGWLR